jgi:hypothetical protein
MCNQVVSFELEDWRKQPAIRQILAVMHFASIHPGVSMILRLDEQNGHVERLHVSNVNRNCPFPGVHTSKR